MGDPATTDAYFHLMVVYQWKLHIGLERVRHHISKLAALKNRGVPGLIDVRIGARLCGYPDETTRVWDEGAVLIFQTHQDYIAFGSSPVHDEFVVELVPDLECYSYVGFAG